MDERLPLYAAIFDHYRRKIESGALSPGDPLPSEAQMALLHGVSNITARRVLNELRRRGLAVRERCRGSFVAPPAGQRRVRDDMARVTLIYPLDSHNTKAAEFIATLYTLLEERGAALSVHFSDDSVEKEEELLQQALRDRVDGIVLYPVCSTGNVATLQLIREMRVPLVLVDRGHLLSDFPVASSDNVSGGRMLTDYLLSRGYENLLFVTNFPLARSTSLRDRYHGYVQAMLRSGRSVRDTSLLLLPDGPPGDAAHRDLLSYLRASRRQTALICVSDPVALALLPCLQAGGLRVPEDVGVAGFDNLSLAAHASPPLTTVQQDFAALATISGELLLTAMEGGSPARLRQTPVSLVVRRSTR